VQVNVKNNLFQSFPHENFFQKSQHFIPIYKYIWGDFGPMSAKLYLKAMA
jgi:uncharacterized protein YutD